MAPTIHCIRHGQGFHNLYSDYTIPDPSLTPLGEEQCATLRTTHFPPENQRRISFIAASPLKRALHTAWLVFQPLLTNSLTAQPQDDSEGNKMRIVAVPDAQETSSDLCDVGTDLPALTAFLATQDQGWAVDTSILTENPTWTCKSFHGRYSPHNDAIKARARATRLFLRDKAAELIAEQGSDDIEMVLVSHGGFLHYLSDDWEGAATRPGTGFSNCEVRSYQFASSPSPVVSDPADPGALHADAEADPHARIVETMSSRRARGLNHPQYSPQKQQMLFLQAMEGWEAQGLERPDRLTDPLSVPVASSPVQSCAATVEPVAELIRDRQQEVGY